MRCAVATILVVIGAAVVAGQTPRPTDHCEQYATCNDCVSHNLCGWCSTPVIYAGNITGKQCAGYNPNGNDPFECDGIYSIEECQVGYECDLANFQCKQAGAGKGKTLQACEANCTNLGQVYLCNHTSMKCHEVPRGTPGSASYEVCEASCAHPSPHPAPPTSPKPPATVYACNKSIGKCEKAEPGKGSSMDVCEQECKKVNPNSTLYYCNSLEHKCVPAPPNFPGESKADCDAECLPHPKPGPPDAFKGTWRGIQINNGYTTGEFDLQVNQESVIFIDVQAATTIKGTPFNVQNGDNVDLWIKVTAGPGSGQTIKVMGQTDNRGPQTFYLLAAFSAPGGSAPSSISSAMASSSGDKVYAFMKCADPICRFTMPASTLLKKFGSATRVLDFVRERHHRHHRGAESVLEHVEREEVADTPSTDPCEAYGANCSYCLQHEFCGWCSEDVQYKDGRKGSQCAGFSKDANKTNAFICEGRYSTLSCTNGWLCDHKSYQCEQNAPAGNGFTKQECEEICRPTPSPTPLPQQYVCNTTTHQCYKCEEEHCPGSMPEGACASACKKPHKGPSSIVIGIWRGLEIQNGYPLVEIDYVFNASSLTAYRSGTLDFTADVTSFGGDEMIFDIKTGTGAGSKISAQYTIANQGSGILEQMTAALSAPNGPIPTSFNTPMTTAGEKELVMNKCQDSPCKFNAPQ